MLDEGDVALEGQRCLRRAALFKEGSFAWGQRCSKRVALLEQDGIDCGGWHCLPRATLLEKDSDARG